MPSVTKAHFQKPVLSQNNLSQPTLRFGRDTIFERNDRFNTVTDKDETAQQELSLLLDNLEKTPDSTQAQFLAEQSQFMYDSWGRVRGKSHLSLALRAIEMEMRLADRSPTTTNHEKALLCIKMGNTLLATDGTAQQNAKAFEILKDSIEIIHTLEEYGQAPKTPPSPTFVHGLYNVGSYYMNNPFYQTIITEFLKRGKIKTKAHMAVEESIHEGLNWCPSRKPAERNNEIANLVRGVGYLKQAIELSKITDPIQKISTAEYLSAQGEVYHLISHLSKNSPLNKHTADIEALNSFKQAFELITSVIEHTTSRHVLMAEKLGTIKIPHLGIKRHLKTPQLEAEYPQKTQDYISTLNEKGIHRPPTIEAERNELDIFFDLFRKSS